MSFVLPCSLFSNFTMYCISENIRVCQSFVRKKKCDLFTRYLIFTNYSFYKFELGFLCPKILENILLPSKSVQCNFCISQLLLIFRPFLAFPLSHTFYLFGYTIETIQRLLCSAGVSSNLPSSFSEELSKDLIFKFYTAVF